MRPLACLPPRSWLSGITRRLKRLRRDERGAVLIYVSLAAAVIIGMVGLALDAGRAMITHHDAQAAADAAALAAAAQLDGQPDAITRATAAAQGTGALVINDHRFGDEAAADSSVPIVTLRFLSGLPPTDGPQVGPGVQPIPASYTTTDPAVARFVEATTASLSHSNTLLLAVGAGDGAQITARAVAGFKQMYCKIPPLMICNPDEVNPGDPFDASARVGAEIIAKTQGGTSAWAPGTFGLLQITETCPTNSASCLRDALAAVTPNVCVETSINVRPGQAAGPANQGMNTRFDIYRGGIEQSAANAPDVNITQNFKQCNQDTVEAGAPFPHDTDNPAPTRVGNGIWDCASYWAANHAQAAPPWCTNATSAPYTRAYVHALESDPAYASKYGRPKCVTPGVPERRMIYLTVINCKAHAVKSNSEDVPVLALLKTFLLRPVAVVGAEAEMDLEILEIVQPGEDDGVLKDVVQLYR